LKAKAGTNSTPNITPASVAEMRNFTMRLTTDGPLPPYADTSLERRRILKSAGSAAPRSSPVDGSGTAAPTSLITVSVPTWVWLGLSGSTNGMPEITAPSQVFGASDGGSAMNPEGHAMGTSDCVNEDVPSIPNGSVSESKVILENPAGPVPEKTVSLSGKIGENVGEFGSSVKSRVNVKVG